MIPVLFHTIYDQFRTDKSIFRQILNARNYEKHLQL